MHMRELKISIMIVTGQERQKICCRPSKTISALRSVEANLFNRFFNDKQRLAFYANRNESLDEWVDHPETVEQKVWPDALGLAERAGPGALFRGLRSVLERDYAVSSSPCEK